LERVKVLVVDDSGFIRRRVVQMLNADPDIVVIGEAGNGRDGIEQVLRLRPDVVTMDIEMPVMDGISAVREIMRRQPTPVIMFSSLTFDGAKATLDALEAGAVDFLPKRFSDISTDAATARKLLQERVKGLARGHASARRASSPATPPAPAAPVTAFGRPNPAAVQPVQPARGEPNRLPARDPRLGDLGVLAIGASTGGPVALQRVLTALPANFPLPVVLIQHMPANFTTAFAERVNGLCKLSVREAADGDALEPGLALLAPGGRHLSIIRRGGKLVVKLLEPQSGQFYKPSVDIAFASLAEVCPGRTLGIVLTGMGSDGCEGARKLKQGRSTVWAQDESSCVIYGMPRAVVQAGIADRVLPLDDIGPAINRLR